MSNFLLKAYYKEYSLKPKFDVIDVMFFNLFLGYLTKKGKKTLSYNILMNTLFYLKKVNAKKSRYYMVHILNQMKPSILLFNKKRGTLVFELPRLLNVEQSTKKMIEWLVKCSKKGKSSMIKNLLVEIENIQLNRGDVVKKNLNIIELALKNRPFFYLLKKKKK